ncbi:hypothetical protein F383_01409 [Gossypium arboreum]|uniref:Uncharacterized protein n=1 Tax=Gossypium arboreum TaxID=29729 RepID=A0A0B0N9Z1_GOSAR|nr:hypothetical protein F383_13147 [Gossypium arboreum]KHG16148.1 hypothetical protein F383_01409 [Gossypium arboreum]
MTSTSLVSQCKTMYRTWHRHHYKRQCKTMSRTRHQHHYLS